MRKWTERTIAEQLLPRNFTVAKQSQLERTRQKIEPYLTRLLLHHRNAFVRELAATILGERRHAESLPALVKAVGDHSEYVSFDAIVAIEKCAGLETGDLVSVLLINLSRPRSAAKRVAAWWRAVSPELRRRQAGRRSRTAG